MPPTATAEAPATNNAVAAPAAAAAEPAGTTAPATTVDPAAAAAAPATEPTKTDPAPGTPPAITLTLPDKAVVDATALERTATFAKEQGLSPDAAQKTLELVDREAAALVTAREAAFLKSHSPGGEEWLKVQERYKQEVAKDAFLHPTPEAFAEQEKLARSVIGRTLSPDVPSEKEVIDFFETSGFGSHPGVLRMLAKVGKMLGEDKTVQPNTTGSAPDQSDEARALRIYPTMRKKE